MVLFSSKKHVAEQKLKFTGKALSMSDLPAPNVRFTMARKEVILQAIAQELLTFEGACQRYRMNEEELRGWQKSYQQAGRSALKVRNLPGKAA